MKYLLRKCIIVLTNAFIAWLALGMLHAQQLGCTVGISPTFFAYTQGTPQTTVFTVAGVPTSQLQIDLTDKNNLTTTSNAQSQGNGTFTYTLNSASLTTLGRYTITAWNINGDGTRTLCDAAFVQLILPALPPPLAGPCGSAVGQWQFSVGSPTTLTNFGPLNLSGQGTLNGTLSTTAAICSGTTITWRATGTYNFNDGSVFVTADTPMPADPPTCVPASNITMQGTIQPGCTFADGTATSTIPSGPNQGTHPGTFQWTKGCDFPVTESSSFVGFGSNVGEDTMATFRGQFPLNSGTDVNFSGRLVQEAPGPIGDDTCWNQFHDASILPTQFITGGEWAVDSQNSYGDDFVGMFPAAVFYYRLHLYRINGNTHNFSCGFTLHQQMTMNNCGSSSAFAPYGGAETGGTNTLTFQLTDTTVSASRAGISSGQKVYP
jgi:hypothetical protein